MSRMPRDPQESDLPPTLGKPAERALLSLGCSRVEHLVKLTEKKIQQLHGIGPRALDQLRCALAQKGLSFAESRRAKD